LKTYCVYILPGHTQHHHYAEKINKTFNCSDFSSFIYFFSILVMPSQPSRRDIHYNVFNTSSADLVFTILNLLLQSALYSKKFRTIFAKTINLSLKKFSKFLLSCL